MWQSPKKDNIFRGLNIPLSQENLKSLLEINGLSVDNIDSIYNIYREIFKKNPNINETIDFNMLDSEILDIFNLEKMIRITTYPSIQEKIVNLNKVKGFSSVIREINDDNWLMQLDKILKNLDKYTELLEDISREEIDKDSAKMLLQVFSQKENYFNISTVSDAKNYFSIRKVMCQRILNNEENEHSVQILSDYSDEDRKKFAILEMMYGIDIEEAKNLFEKYGKDIDKIDIKKYGRNLIILSGIKRILECENIAERYAKNKSIIDNELEEIDYTNISDLEANCIDMYSQMYKETLYSPAENEKTEETEYKGTKIVVYEIQGDFNMFVRTDGARNGYEEPEDFSKKLSTLNTLYHGNCKSYIGQDSISIANENGVKFGYSKSEDGTLLLSAPWDIVSNTANSKFSTASENWNLNCGIQFRVPQEMINNTRHTYNEFVYEKLVLNQTNIEFTWDKPQFTVYVQEPGIVKETDDKWRVSKKAAAQLKIPIVIINRERCVEKEAEKIEELKNILLGKSENERNISEADLIEEIVVKFENNANSVRTSKTLANKYFNSQQRIAMVKTIIGHIKSLESVDFERYQKLYNKFKDVIQNEVDKTISNTGIHIAKDKYGKEFLDALKQKCNQIEESKKYTLTDTYKQIGIEKCDLSDAKVFLEFAKGEINQETKVEK